MSEAVAVASIIKFVSESRCFALSVTGDVQNVAVNLGGENPVREADAKFLTS